MSTPSDTRIDPTIADAFRLDSGDRLGEHPQSFFQWWRSDWGPGPLIALALPLVLSTAFTSVMLFTDRTLLYWVSEDAASAAMGSGTLYWALMCLPTGILGYLSTFVSQYLGAGRPERVTVVYRHAMRLAWMIVPVLIGAFLLTPLPFWFFDHSPELQKLETIYLRTLIVGGIAVLFYSVQCGLMTGLGSTGWVLMIDAISTVVNLALAAMLIFGLGPLPPMGILGAGLATAISFWIKIPMAWWIMRGQRSLRWAIEPSSELSSELSGELSKIESTAWEWGMFRRLITYGAPSGLQMMSESAAFSLILLQVGQLGGLPMAATTLALGLNVMAFVPMLGLGVGVGVLVGNRILQGRVDLASRTVTCALVLSWVYTGGCAILLGFFPELLTSLYALGAGERFEEMRPLLLPLLKIIAVYCIFDGFQIVFVGAIKGAGDTWFVLGATTLIGFGVVGLGLATEIWLGSGLLLWWYVIAVWVGAMAVAFGARYLQGKWKKMQVIERESDL